MPIEDIYINFELTRERIERIYEEFYNLEADKIAAKKKKDEEEEKLKYFFIEY